MIFDTARSSFPVRPKTHVNLEVVRVPLGERVQLNCSVAGNPMPEVIWKTHRHDIVKHSKVNPVRGSAKVRFQGCIIPLLALGHFHATLDSNFCPRTLYVQRRAKKWACFAKQQPGRVRQKIHGFTHPRETFLAHPSNRSLP